MKKQSNESILADTIEGLMYAIGGYIGGMGIEVLSTAVEEAGEVLSEFDAGMTLAKRNTHERYHMDYERKVTDMQMHLVHGVGGGPQMHMYAPLAYKVIRFMNEGRQNERLVYLGTERRVDEIFKMMRLEQWTGS